MAEGTTNTGVGMNGPAHALLRFWWLVLAGLILGGAVAVAVYRLETKGNQTATTKLFVNSPSAPYLRTSQTQLQSQPARVRPVRGKHGTALQSIPGQATSQTQAPDTATLVTAANTYPLLIASDQIARLRTARYGRLPGTVTANALDASTNTYGVYKPSPLPVIEVKTTAKTALGAQRLALATVRAFQSWMTAQQTAHGIPAGQRISVQELEQPVVTKARKRPLGLPVFLGALVFFAVCGLAVLIDRARPATEKTKTQAVPQPAASPHAGR